MALARPLSSHPTRSLADLIAAARDGDSGALGDLYDRHARELLATAYRLLQSREDAEDVVHDVFVGLPELLRKYEERGAFAAWLKKVTARVALARLRENEKHAAESLDGLAGHIHAPRRDPATSVSLETALQKLSPALRAVLVLKEIEGFSHAEVARLLDISVGASEVRLHRAIQALRVELMQGDQ